MRTEWAIPVVVVLPLCQKIFQTCIREIYCSVEFCLVGLLRSPDLSIEMGYTRFVRAKFYAVFHELFLYLVGKKLSATISLNPLDWERHFINDTVPEIQRVFGSPTVVQSKNAVTDTVIHSPILAKSRCNLAGIHLDPVTRHWSGVTSEVLLCSELLDGTTMVPLKNLMNCG
jgi:hypothetical protein